MKTIRFTSDDKQQRLFVAALRKNVHAYFTSKGISKRGNGHMYFKSLVLLALYIAPFVLVLTVNMPAVVAALLMIVMGIGMAGVGMSVMHDAVHGAYSGKNWVNSLMGSSIFLIGSSKTTWSKQHNFLHHTFTNITGYDEDIETKGFIRLSVNTGWKKYQRFQHVYAFLFYGFMTLAKLVGDFPQLLKYSSTGLTKKDMKPWKEVISMILTKSAYLAVMFGLPIWLTDFTWWQVLIGFFIMHMTGGMLMSIIFQMAHVVENTAQPLPDEKDVIHNEWMVHELLTTSDFAPHNPVLGWYIGGLNYQVEHHLFPSICHIHYKAIAPIVQQTAAEYGIPYHVHPTFAAAFGSHWRMLKMLGRNQAPAKVISADVRKPVLPHFLFL